MNWHFVLIQLLDLVAWGFLVLSYYRKDTNRIIIFQIVSTVLYCLHYYLLGAYTGLIICAFEVIRDYLYFRTDKDEYVFYGSAIVFILCTILTYQSYIDLLPLIAGLVDGYTLTKNKKIVVWGATISYTIWVVYCLLIGSYAGALTDGILVVSNLTILLFQYDLFKGKDTSRVYKRRKLAK